MRTNGFHRLYSATALVLALAWNLPAVAGCAPQPSTLDHAIGAVELGANATELPNDRDTWVTERCAGDDGALRDCIFLRHGITYEDYGGGVNYKHLDVHAWNAEDLPFGLSKFDKADLVLKKTAALFRNKLTVTKENRKISALSSGYCYVNNHGKIFSITFNFTDTEQLDYIVTHTEDFHYADE